jgi:RND family efflux transporter MFP subunit
MSPRRLKLILPLGVLAIGALGMLLLFATRPRVAVEASARLAPRVRVVTTTSETLRLSVTTHGTVSPSSESDLVPEVSGPVVRVAPSLVSGGFFERGEVLLEIDPRDYEAALERARAARVRAESEHARARKELERLRSLAEQNVASASRLDDAENAERVTGAALREAVAALGQAERDLERTKLRAPFTGRVREEHVGVGQFVNRGAALATLYATDYVEVRLPISDRELAYLDLPVMRRNGDTRDAAARVTLRADFAGAEHAWTGRVDRTEGEIDARSRMVHVVARVEAPYERDADDPRPPLAVGLFVRAEIEGREFRDVTVLPRAALHGRREGERSVWVVDAADRLRSRRVDVLRSGRDEVVIRGGLAAGERVLVSPLETAVEGMAVRPLLTSLVRAPETTS